MATQKLGDFPAELQQYYSDVLLDIAQPLLVYGDFGEKEVIPANSGVSLQKRRFEPLAASTTALTEGTAGAPVSMTITAITVTIQQFGQHTLQSELFADQSIDQIVPQFTKVMAKSMAESLNLVDRSVLIAGATVQYASTAAGRTTLGSGMRLNTAEILEAVNTLTRNDGKPVVDGFYACILHPDAARDFKEDTAYVNAQLYAGPRDSSNAIVRGTIADYQGVRFYETSTAAPVASAGLSGANVFLTLLIAEQAYMTTELSKQQGKIIYQKPGSSGAVGDALEQIWSLGYKVSHAAKILNDNWLVRIEHTTSRHNAA